MNNLFLILTFFICSASFAQNKIPRCLGTDTKYWNGCVGSYTLPDGSRYIGMWSDGDYNGRGTQIFPNGNKYQGEFKDGKRNGLGTYTFSNNDRYEGEFRNGKREGGGTYFVFNRSKYVSNFRNDLPEGKGVETMSDGSVRNGHWIDGIFVPQVNSPQTLTGNQAKSLAERAKQGDAQSQYEYGMSFILGNGVELKPRVAIEWLMKAAAQGHQSANKQIASMFDFGIQMSNFAPAIKVFD